MEQTEGAEADTKERELIERGGRWLKEDYGAWTEGAEADTKERELIERGGRWLKEDYGADRRSGS